MNSQSWQQQMLHSLDEWHSLLEEMKSMIQSQSEKVLDQRITRLETANEYGQVNPPETTVEAHEAASAMIDEMGLYLDAHEAATILGDASSANAATDVLGEIVAQFVAEIVNGLE